jgi:hypothetical protein
MVMDGAPGFTGRFIGAFAVGAAASRARAATACAWSAATGAPTHEQPGSAGPEVDRTRQLALEHAIGARVHRGVGVAKVGEIAAGVVCRADFPASIASTSTDPHWLRRILGDGFELGRNGLGVLESLQLVGILMRLTIHNDASVASGPDGLPPERKTPPRWAAPSGYGFGKP